MREARLLKQNFFLKSLLVLFLFLFGHSAFATTCTLATDPIFDKEYKIAANYLPILPLRGLAHADVYKEKKSFFLDRDFYIKDSSQEYNKEPYQRLQLKGTVKDSGLLGREILVIGKLNEHAFQYLNKMSFSLPRNAKMRVSAKIDSNEFLNLNIKSDGDQLTNEVKGTYLGKEVDYFTYWRNTKGLLAGIKYDVFTESDSKPNSNFNVICKGRIGDSVILGSGKMTRPNYYEFVEYYGPIMVKTKLTILSSK